MYEGAQGVDRRRDGRRRSGKLADDVLGREQGGRGISGRSARRRRRVSAADSAADDGGDGGYGGDGGGYGGGGGDGGFDPTMAIEDAGPALRAAPHARPHRWRSSPPAPPSARRLRRAQAADERARHAAARTRPIKPPATRTTRTRRGRHASSSWPTRSSGIVDGWAADAAPAARRRRGRRRGRSRGRSRRRPKLRTRLPQARATACRAGARAGRALSSRTLDGSHVADPSNCAAARHADGQAHVAHVAGEHRAVERQRR